MLGDQWLTVIKAEREREIKAVERAHLVDRNRIEEDAALVHRAEIDEAIRRAVRPVAQPGRATADPSL
jgi:hypothetical protein